MLKVFIGWDSNMIDIAETLAYSLKKYSSIPLDIRYLKKSELDFHRNDKTGNTEFTYTRFLVPYLCDYKGKALFMDNDMFCLPGGDLKELDDLDMTQYAIRCRKHNQIVTSNVKMDNKPQEAYPRKNWSSFMLMDCAKLKCWSKEAVETQSPKWLHRFEPVPDEQIGEVPDGWNDLDFHDENTKICHLTTGGPWNSDKWLDAPQCQLWYKYYYLYKAGR